MRLSELLALRQKDLVPPLVPLLPCWSIVITASEIGVSAKTKVLDGSVLMVQRWVQWVNELLPRLRCGNLVGQIWNFNYLVAAKFFKTAIDALGLSGMTTYQTRHSGASIHRVRGFRISAKRETMRSVAPHSPSPAAKQVGNTRATCRSVIDKTIPSPAVHKRMTRNNFRDVFGGPGFLSKATNHLGPRSYVLDTKFMT